MITQVIITAFKPSGEFYGEFDVWVHPQEDTWHSIVEQVKLFKYHDKLPQHELDWLIGTDNSRNDMYPIILKDIK